MDFVHLHNHIHTSLLDGFSTIGEALDVVEEHRQPGFGLSDHGNLVSTFGFIKEAKKRDLVPVPGLEAYCAPINPEGARAKEPIFYSKTKQKGDVSGNGAYTHQTFWATTNKGLHNLMDLSSLSYQHFYRAPRIDVDMMSHFSEGIVTTTGCPSSEVSTRLRLGQKREAYQYVSRLLDIFGQENVFVELMNHGINIECELTPQLLELARYFRIGLLATNDCHYARPEDAGFHEEFLCAQSGAKMNDKTYDEGGKRFAFSGSGYHIRSTEEMVELFPERDFPGAISNTVEIMERCKDISIDVDIHARPKVELPEGMTELDVIKQLIVEGIERLFPHRTGREHEAIMDRVNEELYVLFSNDFIDYFLTVSDYISWTNSQYSYLNSKGEVLMTATGPGRGSVGGSLISYLLGISHIDPLKHDLLFERFLTEGRGNIMSVTLDDGRLLKKMVSDKIKVKDAQGKVSSIFIHQLKEGMEVVE